MLELLHSCLKSSTQVGKHHVDVVPYLDTEEGHPQPVLAGTFLAVVARWYTSAGCGGAERLRLTMVGKKRRSSQGGTGASASAASSLAEERLRLEKRKKDAENASPKRSRMWRQRRSAKKPKRRLLLHVQRTRHSPKVLWCYGMARGTPKTIRTHPDVFWDDLGENPIILRNWNF